MPFTPQALTVTNTGQPIVVAIAAASLGFTPMTPTIQISANQTVTISPVSV